MEAEPDEWEASGSLGERDEGAGPSVGGARGSRRFEAGGTKRRSPRWAEPGEAENEASGTKGRSLR